MSSRRRRGDGDTQVDGRSTLKLRPGGDVAGLQLLPPVSPNDTRASRSGDRSCEEMFWAMKLARKQLQPFFLKWPDF